MPGSRRGVIRFLKLLASVKTNPEPRHSHIKKLEKTIRQRPEGRKRRRREMTGASAPALSGPQGRPLLSAPEAGRVSPA